MAPSTMCSEGSSGFCCRALPSGSLGVLAFRAFPGKEFSIAKQAGEKGTTSFWLESEVSTLAVFSPNTFVKSKLLKDSPK